MFTLLTTAGLNGDEMIHFLTDDDESLLAVTYDNFVGLVDVLPLSVFMPYSEIVVFDPEGERLMIMTENAANRRVRIDQAYPFRRTNWRPPGMMINEAEMGPFRREEGVPLPPAARLVRNHGEEQHVDEGEDCSGRVLPL